MLCKMTHTCVELKSEVSFQYLMASLLLFIISDAIHHLDKLGSNQALAFELFNSKARHLVFKPRGCEFEPHATHLMAFWSYEGKTLWGGGGGRGRFCFSNTNEEKMFWKSLACWWLWR